MKRFNYYLSLMLLLVFTAACSDEFDQPPMVIPTAEHHANMTIAEFKAKHWQDARNYIDTVTEDEIIHGWVTSSDESGNVYKSLYIMDESGYGLSISINQNSLYNNYRIGQEIVLPMKGYFVGKYNGQQQLGYPQWYASGSAWEATFLPQAMWESLVEINGLPNLSMIDTLEVSISDFQSKTDPETLMKYQGRLVRINGVTFDDANGVNTFSEPSASTNRNITDANGQSLTVRNSNYADFRADILPDGEVDVVGLLGSYGTTWQLVLRSASDVIGGGSIGTKSNPYTVMQAIEEPGARGWISGYIVGAIAPEVTNVTGNGDIEWNAPATMNNTLVLADDPNCKDYTKCIYVELPLGSPFRDDANIKDNPVYYQQLLKVKGRSGTSMGMACILDNSGTTDEYVLPFPKPVPMLQEGFDSALPDNWINLQVSGDKAWYQTSFNNNGYAAMTGYKGTKPPFDAWLITPPLDIKNAQNKILNFSTQVNGYGSTTTIFEVYVLDSPDPTTATVKEKLNPSLAKAPASGYSNWVASGDLDLSQWANGVYYIGFRFYATQDANYATWCIDDVTFNVEGGSPTPAAATRADFETMPGRTTTLGTYTSTDGWVATNSTILEGGETDGNPVFAFIGFVTGSTTEYAKAPTINGGTSSVGTIVSPTLTGGMKKLSFNYGYAYSGKNLSFRVDVKQNGSVVKTWTVTNSNMTQKQAYTFEQDCAITGDFTIEITNLCPSNGTGNKDRVSIWNLTWESAD